MPFPEPAYNKTDTLCNSFYDNHVQPLRDSINYALPLLKDDKQFLAGAHLSLASLHESLIHTKKRLAVHHYCKLAARMKTSLCFPLFGLHDVQLAAAG